MNWEPWAIAGGAAFGLSVAAWTGIVYNRWFLRSNPWVENTRRRLWWQYMRHGVSGTRMMPAGAPLGVSFALVSISAWTFSGDPKSAVGGITGLVGFVGMIGSMLLGWLRPRWLLAPWHRAELEREAAGLAPAMPPPSDGPSRTMTRREQFIGYAMVAGLVVAWWCFALSPAILIGAGGMLGILAVTRVRPPSRSGS